MKRKTAIYFLLYKTQYDDRVIKNSSVLPFATTTKNYSSFSNNGISHESFVRPFTMTFQNNY